MKKAKKPIKKVKKVTLDESHVMELLTQWQMPFSIVAKNQNVSEKEIKALANKLVKQKKLTKQQFDELSH